MEFQLVLTDEPPTIPFSEALESLCDRWPHIGELVNSDSPSPKRLHDLFVPLLMIILITCAAVFFFFLSSSPFARQELSALSVFF